MAYAAADVFIISSIEDNLPNTVMESIACGTPVIGFDVGGIPDMVRDGINGLLVPLKDETQLVEKISKFLGNNEMQERMRYEFRRIALQVYDHQTQAKRYIELYTDIIKNN